VIETNRGAEEFVFQDRVLVLRTMGAKQRRLAGGFDVLQPTLRSTRAVDGLMRRIASR